MSATIYLKAFVAFISPLALPLVHAMGLTEITASGLELFLFGAFNAALVYAFPNRVTKQQVRKLTLGASLFLFLALGCVSYDGVAYRQLAVEETAETTELVGHRCTAHILGAAALRDTEGGSRAWFIPLGAGSEVSEIAVRHDRQSLVCAALLDLLRGGQASQEPVERTLNAWRTMWSAGDSLLGEKE